MSPAIISGGGRKEQERIGPGSGVEETLNGRRIMIIGTSEGFAVRDVQAPAGTPDAHYGPRQSLTLDSGATVESEPLQDPHPVTIYDQSH